MPSGLQLLIEFVNRMASGVGSSGLQFCKSDETYPIYKFANWMNPPQWSSGLQINLIIVNQMDGHPICKLYIGCHLPHFASGLQFTNRMVIHPIYNY